MPEPKPICLSLPGELLGPRVRVRPYAPGHGAAIWEATEESREWLQPWLPWVQNVQAPSDSEEFACRSHAAWAVRQDFPMGIWDRESGRYLGSSGLHPRDWQVPAFEIGYWIRKSEEGKGYVREAVSLLTRLAFDVLAAQRVIIRCDPENTRSERVAERLGFVLEGRLRNAILNPAGQPRDALLFSLIPEEYERCRDDWPPAEPWVIPATG